MCHMPITMQRYCHAYYFEQYILSELIPNETYTLGIKAYNNLGLGGISNFISFKANVTNINMDLSIDTDFFCVRLEKLIKIDL